MKSLEFFGDFIMTSKIWFDWKTIDSERKCRVINPKVWCWVNIPALLVGVVGYLMWQLFADHTKLFTFWNVFIAYSIGSLRGYFYVIGLYFAFRNRRKYFTQIHEEMEKNRSFYAHVFWCCVRTSCSAQMMGLCNFFGTMYFYGVRENEFNPNEGITVSSCITKLLLFVVQMFCWEVWFDFGHYWGHRLGHYWKALYDFGHSVHHESISPDAWDGLNITLDDAILTNFFPHMFSMFITTTVFGRSFSPFELNILASYKTFVEVTGHVGADFKGHSFPLFPPLPYYLGIDIGTAAYHSFHHVYYTCNYSKRFSLWDRVFGTIKIPPVLQTGTKKEMQKEIPKVFAKK